MSNELQLDEIEEICQRYSNQINDGLECACITNKHVNHKANCLVNIKTNVWNLCNLIKEVLVNNHFWLKITTQLRWGSRTNKNKFNDFHIFIEIHERPGYTFFFMMILFTFYHVNIQWGYSLSWKMRRHTTARSSSTCQLCSTTY